MTKPIVTPYDFVCKWIPVLRSKDSKLADLYLSTELGASRVYWDLCYCGDKERRLEMAQDYLASCADPSISRSYAEAVIEEARLAGKDVTIREHYFSPELKLVLWSSKCEFVGKVPTILYQLSLLEADDAYASQQDEIEGNTCWMCNHTEYFLSTDTENALKAFKERMADVHLRNSSCAPFNLVDSLPNKEVPAVNKATKAPYGFGNFKRLQDEENKDDDETGPQVDLHMVACHINGMINLSVYPEGLENCRNREKVVVDGRVFTFSSIQGKAFLTLDTPTQQEADKAIDNGYPPVHLRKLAPRASDCAALMFKDELIASIKSKNYVVW